MNPVQELEEVLTFDLAQELAEFDAGSPGAASSTQQLLDDLLGRFEEEDLPVFLAHNLSPDFSSDFGE